MIALAVIPALGKLRQEDPLYNIERPCLQKKKLMICKLTNEKQYMENGLKNVSVF
jgi:hypothetical protein